MTAPATGAFRSLRIFNYRIWAAGALVMGVLASLSLLCASELRAKAKARRVRGSLIEGLRYVGSRPVLKAIPIYCS